MRILVVDDDLDIVTELCAFLTRRGHIAIGAGGAVAGVAALDQGVFAAVLTDMRMPDGSGLDVLRAANRHDSSLLKLVMTGQASDSDLAAARAHGVQSVFFKPLSLRAIHAALVAAQADIAA